MADEDLEMITSGARFWIAGGILVLLTALVIAWVRPTFLGFEREAFVNSHQYVESRKTEVLTLIERYDALEVDIQKNHDNDKVVAGLEAQQRSLKIKIRAALTKIPEESWPEGSRRFK